MSQVYVYFHPVLVDVPDNVILALGSQKDSKLAKQVAANIAHVKLVSRFGGIDVDPELVESVVKA
jgi:hypothetical protein